MTLLRKWKLKNQYNLPSDSENNIPDKRNINKDEEVKLIWFVFKSEKIMSDRPEQVLWEIIGNSIGWKRQRNKIRIRWRIVNRGIIS